MSYHGIHVVSPQKTYTIHTYEVQSEKLEKDIKYRKIIRAFVILDPFW